MSRSDATGVAEVDTVKDSSDDCNCILVLKLGVVREEFETLCQVSAVKVIELQRTSINTDIQTVSNRNLTG